MERCYFAVNDVEALQDKPQKKKNRFNCSPGTKWEDIKITLISDSRDDSYRDAVRIKTPDWEERYTYAELGLSDKRKGDEPTNLWILLKTFAINNGFISRSNTDYDPHLPETAKRLNAHLKKLFGIDESIYVAHYKKEKAYRTKIQFSNQTF